jgi:hypothetical protein
MTVFLEHALDYARRGWPVFPLRPRAKIPATAHGLKDATTDDAQVVAWWSRDPQCNIGIRTGIAFDVLDVDGDEGIDEGSRLFGGDEVELPPGPAVLTPTAGLHLYFQPTGLGNRARFRPGLDWRGDGGYVVAPPSVGANGYAYQWWPLESCVDSELVPAPGWLVDLLERDSRDSRDQEPNTQHIALLPKRGVRYALAALENEARLVAAGVEGERNTLLFSAAYSLSRLVPDSLDAQHIERVLLAAARDCGLPDQEARRTIRSALQTRGVA